MYVIMHYTVQYSMKYNYKVQYSEYAYNMHTTVQYSSHARKILELYWMTEVIIQVYKYAYIVGQNNCTGISQTPDPGLRVKFP